MDDFVQNPEMGMIMSKKNRKQTNTFLQSKNKKNRLKINSNVSSNIPKYSPIKVDWFGRVCRFVNQKGSVLPTDTEMFGCEIVRDLPNYIRDFVKKIGFDVVIRVPISNHDGLTGSGKRGECNTNSTMMSLSFGGNRLYGYGINQYEKPYRHGKNERYSILHHHSVWNTPEGKSRCVTDYSNSQYVDDRKEVLFVPVGLNSIEEKHCLGLVKIRMFESNKNVDFMKTDTFENSVNGVLDVRLKMKHLVRYLRKKGNDIIFQKLMSSYDSNEEEIYWRGKIEESHFGKVSLFTGRSWDYFKNKIINTYFPTKQVSLSF